MNCAVIDLTDIANGGDSLGRDDNDRVVFVPLAVPGERVRIEIAQDKKRFARGRLVEVLEPSPYRIEARCPHFGICGGCHFQHIAYPEQLRLKRRIVLDQLTRIGGFDDPPVNPVISNPDQWAYSSYVTFKANQSGKLAFWSPALNELMPVSTCHIIQPQLLDLMQEIDLPPPAPDQISLRLGDDDSVMAILISDDGDPPALETEIPISAALLLSDGTSVNLVGDSYLRISVSDRSFRVSAASFFYPSVRALESLIETVVGYASLSGTEQVVELYSGVGSLSAFLAVDARAYIGIEHAEHAIADAAENLDDYDHVSLYLGAVEEVLPSIYKVPDIMILDPPGSGIATLVHDEIARLLPNKLIYIGSDMATFARDAKRIARNGYDLIEVQPVDMYPQNYRVVSLAKFRAR